MHFIMLVKELIKHLEKMDENATVKLRIKTKLDSTSDEEAPTYSEIETIELGENKVVLKGDDELVEWD
ncbi:TPA: hypothetical protein IUV20_002967 [Enterococcus faecalis]|nr:hypothetical protein [Enterococcus faecalis]EHB5080242.1 hypothetical protein [Enterococcus faecalis]EHU4989677.1 hypothetical protein [Enterococcus faecalis]EIX8381036.1 hypothetical protein [Enterococcus faecalis]EIY9291428.1 hypothetical protein [Enterococcus faecalis]